MINTFAEIKCDGCGLGCGGIFRSIEDAERLRERLDWTRLAYPFTLIAEADPVHYCPPCWRGRATAGESR